MKTSKDISSEDNTKATPEKLMVYRSNFPKRR